MAARLAISIVFIALVVALECSDLHDNQLTLVRAVVPSPRPPAKQINFPALLHPGHNGVR